MKRGGPIARRTPLRPKTELRRTPFKTRTPAPIQVGSLGVRGPSSVWKRIGSGLKAFPRRVLVLLFARDEWCQRCGSPGPLHSHHRRAKGIGGDRRAHSQCACNGVRLCCVDWQTGVVGGCHMWVHLHPEQARDDGWIVSQEVAEPGNVQVRRGSADGTVLAMWPTCDGQWVSESPAERAA